MVILRPFLFGIAVVLATSAAASAQTDAPVITTPQKSRIDSLFDRLAAAKDEVEAKGISEQIQRAWLKSGSDTSDLLMTRVVAAMQAKDTVLALDLLDSILALKPDWAEAWNKRATVLYQSKDFDGSLRDIRQVLALEPRHFGALAGLGMILRENGRDRQALAVLRQVLKIHPHLTSVDEAVKRMAPTVDGQSL